MSPRCSSILQNFFKQPSKRVEILLWAVFVLVALGIRLYFIHLLPVALWTGDSTSYAESAYRWVHTGVWETDPRRGAIYSLLIALCCKATGTVNSVMVCQHFLGFVAILFTMIVARVALGRRALFPLMVCGISYAVYGTQMLMEHLLRNETLLFLFASFSFGSLLLALNRKEAGWLWITGISSALLALTKNVYVPFPFLVAGGYLFFFRDNFKWAARQALVFCVAFALPFAANKVLNSVTQHTRPPEPQDGILFYGRTAQFTLLEKGKHLDLKAAIAQEVLDYRQLPKLENNVILKRTVVPHLQRILTEQGKTPSDLNRLCWDLGLEGVNANRTAYAKQVFGDLAKNITKINNSSFREDISGYGQMLQQVQLKEDPLTNLQASLDELKKAQHKGHFKYLSAMIASGLLFKSSGIPLLASILLLVFYWRSRNEDRFWWLVNCGIWFFTMILLSTVGRPLHRYGIPILPTLFATITFAMAQVWDYLRSRFGFDAAAQQPETAVAPTPVQLETVN